MTNITKLKLQVFNFLILGLSSGLILGLSAGSIFALPKTYMTGKTNIKKGWTNR